MSSYIPLCFLDNENMKGDGNIEYGDIENWEIKKNEDIKNETTYKIPQYRLSPHNTSLLLFFLRNTQF